MGIYDSGLSCWERNQRGLPADHAGEGTIGTEENKDQEIDELITQIQSDVKTDVETGETPKKKNKTKNL